MIEGPSALPIRRYNIGWLEENINKIPSSHIITLDDNYESVKFMRSVVGIMFGGQQTMSSDGHSIYSKGWGEQYKNEILQVFR